MKLKKVMALTLAAVMTLALLAGPGAADWLGGRLDWLCTVGALAAGLFLAGVKGNFTLLLVAFWLLALSFRQNFCRFQQKSLSVTA